MSKSRLPVPQYNYRQNLKKEERAIYRRIAVIMAAFFVILVIIWFMGTNFINALGLLSNGNNEDTSTTTENQDLPLLEPTIERLPSAINTDSITVEGKTNPAVKVILFVNTKETSNQEANEAGNFKFEKVKLTEGLNLIKIVVENKDKEKEESSTTITFDKTKPGLALSSPTEGQNFPKNTKTITVIGTTEAEAIVHVNGSQAIVDGAGKFSYNLTPNGGKMVIDVNSVDEAGNLTNVKINVTVDSDSDEGA